MKALVMAWFKIAKLVLKFIYNLKSYVKENLDTIVKGLYQNEPPVTST